MRNPAADSVIAAVRQFSRFYTRKLGILNEGIYKSPLSLGKVRVLYEIAHRTNPNPSQVAADLGLDAGYFSRLLRDLEKQKLIRKTQSARDGRRTILSLTAQGRKTFAQLNATADEDVRSLLRDLSATDHSHLISAMSQIQSLFGESLVENPLFLLRMHQPGDMGWVVQSHGLLYSMEHGYNQQYEADVAEIVTRFLRNFDSRKERCWIAEKDGENVGSIFCVKESETVARLRLLLVHPKARGRGLGSQLVNQCLRFASQAGYRRMILTTVQDLHAARTIYEKYGFRRIERKKHSRWGPEVIGEKWELSKFSSLDERR